MLSVDLTACANIVGIRPDCIDLEINDVDSYDSLDTKLRIGSFVEISDGPNHKSRIVAVVKSFQVKNGVTADGSPKEKSVDSFVVSMKPLGAINENGFHRGGGDILIPPKHVSIASKRILEAIYSQSSGGTPLSFGSLAQDEKVRVVLDGDRFFGKHIAVVGSTGSGKSSTVAAILQRAIEPSPSQEEFKLLNNSHIIIFDLHGEYSNAFPQARVLGIDDLVLPYWFMTSEELEELFIESGDNTAYNQLAQFRLAVAKNKELHSKETLNRNFVASGPRYFSMDEVLNYLSNLNAEMISKDGEGLPLLSDDTFVENWETDYFKQRFKFAPNPRAGSKVKKGSFTGEFDRLLMRLEAKVSDHRLRFLFNEHKGADDGAREQKDSVGILRNLLGYGDEKTNVTVFDLSGMPFEVVNLVVSLVSRIVFTFSMDYKRRWSEGDRELPFLLVLEEAHRYISRHEGTKNESVRRSVERIAKEGRKYGTSLMIVSQRPSEISETVFAQCNNFVAMRLTNPSDQNYIRRLLPEDSASIVEELSALERSQAILIGDSLPTPALLKVDEIANVPRSTDVPFLEEWRFDWLEADFNSILRVD